MGIRKLVHNLCDGHALEYQGKRRHKIVFSGVQTGPSSGYCTRACANADDARLTKGMEASWIGKHDLMLDVAFLLAMTFLLSCISV